MRQFVCAAGIIHKLHRINVYMQIINSTRAQPYENAVVSCDEIVHFAVEMLTQKRIFRFACENDLLA